MSGLKLTNQRKSIAKSVLKKGKPMTDFTKPGYYRTRDGRKAEVLKVYESGYSPSIIGQEGRA
jgi:hypothetical protein